jgi:hypothetical protein
MQAVALALHPDRDEAEAVPVIQPFVNRQELNGQRIRSGSFCFTRTAASAAMRRRMDLGVGVARRAWIGPA